MNDQGLDYIREQLALGIDAQDVKKTMLGSGWSAADIDTMINSVIGGNAQTVSQTAGVGMVQPRTSSTGPRKHSPFKVVIRILIFLLIIGATVGIYYFFTPEKVLARAVTKVQTLRTFSYNCNFSGNIQNSSLVNQFLTGSNPLTSSILNSSAGVLGKNTTNASSAPIVDTASNAQITLSSSGQSDTTDPNQPKFSAELNASAKIGSEPLQAIAGKVEYLGNNLYFKASQLPNTGLAISNLIGQWFEVDGSQLNQTPIAKIKNQNLTQTQISSIEAIYKKDGFIVVGQMPKPENLDNTLVLHYSFTVDKTKLESFIEDYNKTVLVQPQPVASLNVLSAEINNLPALSGDVWVGIFDSYLRKINFNFSLEPTPTLPLEGNFTFGLELKDFNQPVMLETPINTKSLNDLTQTMNASNVSVIAADKNDDIRKADLANLKTALQKYYEVNHAYPVSTTMVTTLDINSSLKLLKPTYIGLFPVDPLSPKSFYGYQSDGKSFELTAVLENKTDPAGKMVGNVYLYELTDK